MQLTPCRMNYENKLVMLGYLKVPSLQTAYDRAVKSVVLFK